MKIQAFVAEIFAKQYCCFLIIDFQCIFRQHAASIYGFVRQLVSFVSFRQSKKNLKCNISLTEAQIFMKFETYVYKIVLDHQPNFHKDPCKDARARGENARTCDALQRFRSESTKIKKMRFSAIFE